MWTHPISAPVVTTVKRSLFVRFWLRFTRSVVTVGAPICKPDERSNMSDGAQDTAEGDAAEPDEAVLRRVLQLGAAGRGRAEIAAALGMSPTVLMAREAQDAALAASLGEAAALSQAWWEARAREACEAGRFS